MKIGITFDLRDDYRALGFSEEAIAECDKPTTIDALENAIRENEHETVRIGNIWRLTQALATGQRWDMVFNIAEGMFGIAREVQVPALLDAYSIPYTFSAPEVLALCQHKAYAKLAVAAAGLATAPYALITDAAECAAITLPYPLFAKPVAEGTSKGIDGNSRILSAEQLETICRELLEKFQQPVLVETFLSGREFTVGILGNGASATAIGAVEVNYTHASDQHARTYMNKEKHESFADYHLPEDALSREACRLALACWNALGCRDAGRIDIRCDAAGTPHFIEANPLSGLTPGHSDLPVLAMHKGISYPQLIGSIINHASTRVTHVPAFYQKITA